MKEIEVQTVKTKKRGRPRKDSRNAAVFLAMFWRTEILGETSNAAQEWVRQRWQHHGLGADRKDVRDARRFAKDRGLVHSFIFAYGEGWMAVELVDRHEIQDDARVWIWHPEFHEAVEGRVKNAQVRIVHDRLQERRNALSKAAAALFDS